jgi:phasin family protein
MADATNYQGKSKGGRKGQVAKAMTGAAVAAVEVGKIAVEKASVPVEQPKPVPAKAPAAPAPVAKAPAAPAPVAQAAVAKAPAAPAPVAQAAKETAVPAKAPQSPAPKNEFVERKAEAPKPEATIKTEVSTTPSGETKMTDTINNTVNKAQEATQQAAEQFRGVVSQANERGQAAMERSARFAEQVADLTRGNLEAVVASSKTAAKYVETLAQGAADYSRRSFEEASTAMRSFAEVKSPTDFFRLQSDYARGAFDAMIGETARVSETVVKMTGEVAEPITSRYAVAAERMKTIAA